VSYQLPGLGMYLPEMIRSLQQLKVQDDDRIIYGQCLILLLEDFLGLVIYLDSFPEFSFTYGLKKVAQPSRSIKVAQPSRSIKAPSFEDGMRDRNRNFIVIGLINLAALNVPLRGSGDIFQKAQNVCCFLSPLPEAVVTNIFSPDHRPSP
jgi:hypothetical protein